MRKILSFLLSSVTAAAALAAPVYADAATDELGDYIAGRLEQYQQGVIDIEKYVDKYGWSFDDTLDAMTSVFYSHPEFFFIDSAYTPYGSYEKITGVVFEYDIPKSKLAEARKKVDAAAKKAVAGITDDMSDVDKALYVHDYIIQNCRYDFSHSNYNAYNCLVDGSSVCQGYTLAYSYILNNYLGIECAAAYSMEQNHIWNYVRIGRNWYHVDLTLDDVNDSDGKSTYDRYGGICHDNFLMSDTKCRNSSSMHRNWKIAGNHPSAGDTSYDNAFWNGVNSAICYDNGNYYYLSDGGKSGNKHIVRIHRYNISKQTASVIAKLNTSWYCLRNPSTGKLYDYGLSMYSNIFSSIVLMNDKLYFNSNKCVYSFDISTKAVKKIFTLNKGDDMQIFGMCKYGDKLRIAYRKDLTYQEKYMKLVFA